MVGPDRDTLDRGASLRCGHSAGDVAAGSQLGIDVRCRAGGGDQERLSAQDRERSHVVLGGEHQRGIDELHSVKPCLKPPYVIEAVSVGCGESPARLPDPGVGHIDHHLDIRDGSSAIRSSDKPGDAAERVGQCDILRGGRPISNRHILCLGHVAGCRVGHGVAPDRDTRNRVVAVDVGGGRWVARHCDARA